MEQAYVSEGTSIDKVITILLISVEKGGYRVPCFVGTPLSSRLSLSAGCTLATFSSNKTREIFVEEFQIPLFVQITDCPKSRLSLVLLHSQFRSRLFATFFITIT
jgi:hypothetical protein